MDITPGLRCALRMLLAMASEPLKPLSVPELMAVAKASPALVERVLMALREARILQPVPGGLRLGFSERAIDLASVFAALGARPGPDSCPVAVPGCPSTTPCSLCWALIEADIAAMETLRSQTLASLRRTMPPGHASCS